MPELPEVETTGRGIAPHVLDQPIVELKLYRADLRWPIPPELPEAVAGRSIRSVVRRGKYLILDFGNGVALAHLGMSGSLRIVDSGCPLKKHDHWDLIFESGRRLRFNDPRRFGALLWESGDWRWHPLIRQLGPEPLGDTFSADYLYARARGRTQAIKNFVMDSKVVVGVGNIYAAESLFKAGIHPELAAGKLSLKRTERLVDEIKKVLTAAIEAGGTTLRDYVNGNGQPGYFQQELWVYGREGQPCKLCGETIKNIQLGQRASCYCRCCQKR